MTNEAAPRSKATYEAILRRGWGAAYAGYYKPRKDASPVLILVEPRTVAERRSLDTALAEAERTHGDARIRVRRQEGKWRPARSR